MRYTNYGTIPDLVCFAKAHNYVKIDWAVSWSKTVSPDKHAKILARYSELLLTFYEAGKTYAILRRKSVMVDHSDNSFYRFNVQATFPIDGVLTSTLFNDIVSRDKIFSTLPTKKITVTVGYVDEVNGDEEIGTFTLYVINGAGGEIVGSFYKDSKPSFNPEKVIAYPAFFNKNHERQLFNFNIGQEDIGHDWLIDMHLPILSSSAIAVFDTENQLNGQLSGWTDYGGDDLWFEPEWEYYDGVLRIEAHGHPVTIPLQVDNCTDGFFTRWLDRHGIFRYYRWTPETEIESSSINNTYRMLDETLTPYNTFERTNKRTLTLHSRLVDRDTFDLCRTIIDGRNLQYWDTSTNQWRDCYVDDAEVEDNGKRLKDLVVELSINELTI